MKLTLCSAIGLSLILASCSTLDPEYAAYKKQKEAEQAAGQSPYGTTSDYGIPGASETGNYAPYQPIPGVANPPAAPAPIAPLPNGGFPAAPTPGIGAPPVGNTVPHVVVKGDSLWGLAQRYGTSVEAIQAANGLADTNIQTGRTLQIPSSN